MANVFVEFASDEDLAVEVARFVSLYASKEKDAQEKFFQDAEKLAQDGKFADVLSSVVPQINAVIAEAPEADAEPALLATLSLLKKLPAEALQSFVSQLISVLSSDTENKTQFRLKLLNHAYNILSTSPAARFELFKAILKYALASHNESTVAKSYSDVEALSKSWNVGLEQLREVYKLLRDVAKSRKQLKQAHDCNVKYFELFKVESDAALASTADDALRGIVDAVNLPGLYSFDSLLELLPVKRLEQANPGAWRLVNVFVGGTLDEFRALPPADIDQFKAAGLDEEAAVSKLRLLTIATVCSQSNQVPYGSIAKALQVDESEVESYVVSAISEDIIDARLDQLRRAVLVTRTVQRQFTKAQWAQLADTLQTWKTNVRSILASIETVKDQQFASLPPQH